MIAILIATKTEARHLLRSLYPVKNAGVFHYRGEFAGRSVAVFLTRPGVASKEQVRRFLRLYSTDLIIATGSCAALSSEFTLYDTVVIAKVTNPNLEWRIVADHGHKCVTVDHLIADDETKYFLRERTGADVLDMETWKVAKILSEPEFSRRRFVAVRVVGDLPGERLLLEKEKKLRELTARTPSGRLSFAEMVRFGIIDYLLISYRRYRIAAAIAAIIRKVIAPQR